MGLIIDRYNDLRNPDLGIDAVRPELPEFTVSIDAAGVVTPSAVQPTLKNYVLSIYGMQAWVKGGTVAGDAAPALVTLKINEVGRQQSVFRSSVNLAGFVEQQQALWFMPYRCLPGTDLEAVWTVATTWTAEINAARVFGVRLLADYYLCSR